MRLKYHPISAKALGVTLNRNGSESANSRSEISDLTPASPPDELLRPAEVARRTGYAETTLATLRVRGCGPPFRKRAGGRAVFYVWRDVLAWLGEPSDSTKSSSSDSAA